VLSDSESCNVIVLQGGGRVGDGIRQFINAFIGGNFMVVEVVNHIHLPTVPYSLLRWSKIEIKFSEEFKEGTWTIIEGEVSRVISVRSEGEEGPTNKTDFTSEEDKVMGSSDSEE